MSRDNDTIREPLPAGGEDTDPTSSKGRSDDVSTDPATPKAFLDEAPLDDGRLDGLLAGLAGRRAPILKRRQPESDGLSGAYYDGMTTPMKSREAVDDARPVVVNDTARRAAPAKQIRTAPMVMDPLRFVPAGRAFVTTTPRAKARFPGARWRLGRAGLVAAVLLVATLVFAIGRIVQGGRSRSPSPPPSVLPAVSSPPREVPPPDEAIARSSKPEPSIPAPDFSARPVASVRPRGKATSQTFDAGVSQPSIPSAPPPEEDTKRTFE